MQLLLASQNSGKIAEMRQLLAGLPFQVIGPRDAGLHDAPEETGETFAENARLKARHYSQLSGHLTVADDSGLEVDALGGAPGLYSARYGGPEANDADRNRLVLDELDATGDPSRTARFVCAVAVARGDEVLFEARETVEGVIAHEPQGVNGFGYDPIFFYLPFGKTFGEVAPAMKDTVSHRGKAFARVREFLASIRATSS
jgi:XTP/dITP diphosphohydrolase